MATTIGFVVYPVRDMARAVAFYRDAVGLGEPQQLSENWMEFPLGQSALALTDRADMVGVEPGSQFTIGFEVDDLDKTIERLKGAGAKMDEPFEAPNCNGAFVHDPDGNRFAVHRLKKA